MPHSYRNRVVTAMAPTRQPVPTLAKSLVGARCRTAMIVSPLAGTAPDDAVGRTVARFHVAKLLLTFRSGSSFVSLGEHMIERRTVQRGRTYLGGQIAFNHRSSTMDCVVRNMSQFGARIELPSTVALPGEFDLMIHHQGESRRARIVWRTDAAAGVAFQEAGNSAVVSVESARKIRQVEVEREMLARRVAQLSEPA